MHFNAADKEGNQAKQDSSDLKGKHTFPIDEKLK